MAQQSKMSPLIRQLATTARHQKARRAVADSVAQQQPLVCAFIRLDEATADEVLSRHGARSWAQWGDLHIITVATDRLDTLAAEQTVSRIEARRANSLQMDSTAMHVNALPVYAGTALPQAFTGKGVVMGIMDIGFDLTHPNFYNPDLSQYRISRLWDMLDKSQTSARPKDACYKRDARNLKSQTSNLKSQSSNLKSQIPVGQEYIGREALLAKGCSADGQQHSHGTHTLGIAAGSGYDSPYRGMAPESDICLVANATTNNAEFIDSLDYDLFTSAMDALGFKYIFDHAQAEDKPCVISFSEGSQQYFDPEDVLLYAALDSMTGPGRIIVASAGNNGRKKTHLLKPQGQQSAGSFIHAGAEQCFFMLRASQHYHLRMATHPETSNLKSQTSNLKSQTIDSLVFCPSDIFNPQTSNLNPQISNLNGVPVYTDTLQLTDGPYAVMLAYYPSVYNERDTICEVLVTAPHRVGNSTAPLSLELTDGGEGDVECFVVLGELIENDINPQLCDGDNTHGIGSPSSAPAVISVGATTYRKSFVNFRGETQYYCTGENGQRGDFSSIGPTLDGRIKPDVLAPGANVVSSYSSYYLEANPNASTTSSHIKLFDHNGRTYLWASDAGTSMSAPVVGGAIALWLQAKPDLTPQEVINVLARTSTHNAPSLTYPNNLWGHGQIDVYRGLLDILGISSINPQISNPGTDNLLTVRPTDHGTLLITYSADLKSQISNLKSPLGRRTLATNGTQETSNLNISLFSLSGQKVWSTQISAQPKDARNLKSQTSNLKSQISNLKPQISIELSLPPLPPGVYVVQVGSLGSTLIRL